MLRLIIQFAKHNTKKRNFVKKNKKKLQNTNILLVDA